MRFFLWILTLFATAIGIAVLARFNPGNVVLFYPPYRVDMSLNFFVVVLVAAFVLLLTIVNAVRATMALPRRVAEYRAMRQLRESGRALHDALRSYLEGRFGRAEKSAARAAASLTPSAAIRACGDCSRARPTACSSVNSPAAAGRTATTRAVRTVTTSFIRLLGLCPFWASRGRRLPDPPYITI